MSKRILIENGRIALMEENDLLFLTQQIPGIQAEQIYLGRVDRIMKGLEAAWVALGKDRTGFLPFSECSAPPRSGDKVLVQVKKPPVGDKAPYLTADIALAGRYVILTPRSGGMGVSQKITDEEARAALLDAARRLAPEGMGLVMRTEAPGAGENALEEEVRALKAEWEEILRRAAASPAPALIRDREAPLSRLIRDEHGDISEILTDDPAALPPDLPLPVRQALHPFALYGVQSKWDKANQRKVWLPCGGFLVIDKTEALTVIDVNSGKFSGGKAGAESAFLKLNLEAAEEIARLMRLRSMGGIIIVDFVDMQEENSRRAVQEKMEEALRRDPVKCVVHGFTRLGLMELTRKKSESPQG